MNGWRMRKVFRFGINGKVRKCGEMSFFLVLICLVLSSVWYGLKVCLRISKFLIVVYLGLD